MIVELALDVNNTEIDELANVLNYLEEMKIAYYIEPESKYRTLDELEADCEGK